MNLAPRKLQLLGQTDEYLGPGRLLLLPQDGRGDGTWPAAGICSLGDCTFLWLPAILSKLLLARTLVCPQVRLNIGHQGGSLGIKCKKDKNNDLVVTKIIDDGPAYLEGYVKLCENVWRDVFGRVFVSWQAVNIHSHNCY